MTGLYEKIETCEEQNQILIDLYMEKLELLKKCNLETEDERDEHIKDCYVKIKDLSILEYGETDKRSLKALRNLVIMLTRKKQIDEALENLEKVEKIEASTFGNKSKQLAKTFSLKATLYLRNGDRKKAKHYFT